MEELDKGAMNCDLTRNVQTPLAKGGSKPTTFLRYWGSYLKSLRHAGVIAADFRPLVKRGWRCFLVLERPPEDLTWLKEFNDLGVTIFYAPRPRGQFDLGCIRRIATLVRRTGTVVFHCDNMHTSPLIGAALGGAKVRIWSKLDMDPAFKACRPPTLKEQLGVSNRISCWLCHRVIAVSTAVRDEMVARGIPEEKFIVRNSPRIYAPPEQTMTPQAIRKGWGCSANEVVVLTLGRCIPVKAWDILLLAFAPVVKAAPEARLILVGSYATPAEKPFYALLQGLLQEHQIADKVIFTGFVAEVWATLKAADVFVLPSLSEGASFALIEGLDAGLPCVATGVGNAREVIRDGENGFIVPRCDPAALSRALAQLVQDQDLRRRFAANVKAPDHIPDMHESAEQFALDYEALLQNKPVPVFADPRLISGRR
jgi:glycosyltransferase involved in cell wall biosynthesis